MPYYTREMIRWMRLQERLAKGDMAIEEDSGNKGNKDDSGKKDKAKCGAKDARVLRTLPSHVDGNAEAAIPTFDLKTHKEMNFDEKRLKYMRNLLRLQMERIQRIDGTVPASGKEFANYQFDWREPIKTGGRAKLFNAKHRGFANLQLVVKLYEAGTGAFAHNPMYLKFLRHIGKKHPYIVQTWEVFLNDKGHVLVVQEFANRHDLVTFMAKNGIQKEQRVCTWANQLYKALDYLGDMGICHRGIKPKQVLLHHKELSVRLTGFYDSVLYWDPKKDEIANIPCLPVSAKNRSDGPDFQAPEVYGNGEKEEFDPIKADLWSFAAVIFFAVTNGGYPYDYKVDNPHVEKEIRDNVNGLDISEHGKSFLAALLNTNAMARLTFDKINKQHWFDMLERKNVVCSQTKVA